MPKAERPSIIDPNVEPRPKTLIVYAGTSPRRQSFIQHVFSEPQFTVISRSGGEEPETEDVHMIMRGKITHVISKLKQEGKISAKDHPVVIAADIRTRILTGGNDEAEHTYTKSWGKPDTSAEVQQLFRSMSHASRKSDCPPFYVVESSSGVQFKLDPIAKKDTTITVLDPNILRYFSTDEGFAEYQNNFFNYYHSRVYTNNGRHPPATLMDVAGGLSLPVLLQSNAVLELDGVRHDSSDFRDAAKTGIFKVAVGISPCLLKPLQPNIENIVNEWGWLEGCTSHVLGEVKELIL